MRGAVSAGMCLVLEAAGLMSSLDRVYGCSSGALSGCFAAAGQASLWATSFEDCATRAFIDPSRASRAGRPVLDLDFLFDEVIARRRPLSEAGLAAGPEFRAVAVSASRAELRVLRDFESAADVLAAAAGELLDPGADGRTADLPRGADGRRRSAGADPVSHGAARGSDPCARPALARRELSRAQAGQARGADARPLPSCSSCRCCGAASERYNRDAAELERREQRSPGLPLVRQIAVPPGSRLVPRFSIDRARIVDSVRLGAYTMASALYGAPATRFWQPFPELLAA